MPASLVVMSQKHKDLFGQVLVALVTPMTPDGEVDWKSTEKLIDYVISNGADGVVVTGTTGETSTLTDAEKIKLVEVGKSVAAGRAKIITGGGSNETAHAIQLYKASEAAGADGVMIVTPYYNKPNPAGIQAHFEAIAEAVPEMPLIAYNIPSRVIVDSKSAAVRRWDGSVGAGIAAHAKPVSLKRGVLIVDDSITKPYWSTNSGDGRYWPKNQ